MTWQQNPFATTLLIASLLSLGIVIVGWRRRGSAGSYPFVVLMGGVTAWLASNTIELGFSETAPRLFWANMKFIGVTIVPAAWLLLTLEYTGRGHLVTRRTVALLLIEPILLNVLIWTNDWHHLIRSEIVLDTSALYPIWQTEMATGFWIHTAYSYLVLAAGTLLMMHAYMHTSTTYRRQIRVLLAAAFFPWLSNAVNLVLFRGDWYLDPTPLSFLVTGIILALGLYGVQLVTIAPIARDNVIEKMKGGMLVLDAENRIVDINPAAMEILSCTEAVIGQPAAPIFAPWPELTDQYRHVTEIETEIDVPYGELVRTYRLAISPFYDRNGSYNGRLVMAHEITAQKQAERVQRQARETAEAANFAKTTFLTTMSHELRTPLAAIIGYSELLQEQSHASGYEHINPKLNQIGAAANHLLFIINDILEMAKIEAGYLSIHCERFSIASMLEGIFARVEPAAAKNCNKLEISLAPDLRTMESDEPKVSQILLNILENAAKFTKDGTIHFDGMLTDSGNGRSDTVCFQVRDTGIGIPKDKLSLIFQPFVQADPSHTRNHQGSGLGLAISYRYCLMLGGIIEVESEEGKGTLFTVKMPVHFQPRNAIIAPPEAM